MKLYAEMCGGILFMAIWAFTYYRIYSGEFKGRYTRQRWLLSVASIWGIAAYWLTGDSERKPRSAANN